MFVCLSGQCTCGVARCTAHFNVENKMIVTQCVACSISNNPQTDVWSFGEVPAPYSPEFYAGLCHYCWEETATVAYCHINLNQDGTPDFLHQNGPLHAHFSHCDSCDRKYERQLPMHELSTRERPLFKCVCNSPAFRMETNIGLGRPNVPLGYVHLGILLRFFFYSLHLVSYFQVSVHVETHATPCTIVEAPVATSWWVIVKSAL